MQWHYSRRGTDPITSLIFFRFGDILPLIEYMSDLYKRKIYVINDQIMEIISEVINLHPRSYVLSELHIYYLT